MRWTVTGATGMLGTDLTTLLRERGDDVVALGRSELDITDPGAVEAAIEGADVVVNCAAHTAVDAAEDHESDAFLVNAVGPSTLARATAARGQRLVHFSTDYVFDGDGRSPYEEDAPIRPRSAYGRTKAAGEWAIRSQQPDHLIIRTAWLYGASGPCFPKSIANAASTRDTLQVVDDQVGQPTWTRDLADLAVRLVVADAVAGTYHGTSRGSGSWFDFAQAVVSAAGRDPRMVERTTSDALARPARRPPYSVLGHDALRAVGVEPIGDWRERWAAAAPQVLARS
ncbi:dTDP-4-dehydrorhamnose reductase [Sanguibacter sp. 25GB23B1]|uniref:dTDP-4-dehydrorhamnose reductase n=1 Tax=unclassified Sanguibacter TaxID=2645534 RepID=UPI0032AE839B